MLFAKNEKELKIRLQTIIILSKDWGIEFGMEKCAKLIMWSCKNQLTEGIKLPNQEQTKKKKKNKIITEEPKTLWKPSTAAGISLKV